MSIEKIIRYLEEECIHDYGPDSDCALVELQYINLIVTALKAGKRMADAYGTSDVELWSARRAWDDATKGDV